MPITPQVEGLFKPTQFNTIVNKGSLVAFKYSYWKHDPYPLVIVTDVFPNNMIRGVNIHYLTFNYVKTLLRGNAGNPTFSYGSIRGDQYLVSAFRSYKWNGISQIKKLDSDFILTVMSLVRTFDPMEVERIREIVQEQLRQQVNPKADELGVQQPQQPQQNIGQINPPNTGQIPPIQGL